MKTHSYIISILSLVAALTLCSCEHKDLCYEHPHRGEITVIFDWSQAPDANPAGMCIYFYPTDGGNPTRADLRGRDGGKVQIAEGEYMVMAYNNDTEAITFMGTSSYTTHQGTTRTGDLFDPVYRSSSNNVPRAKGAEDEPVRISPDMMWGATVTPFTIKIGDEITLTPQQLVCHYTYEIRNVKGLRNVNTMCASLTGLSSTIHLADATVTDELTTIPFGAHFERIGTTITGEFYTFGYFPGTDNNPACDHRMVLYIWMNDGTKYYVGTEEENFRVTDQVHSAPDPKNVHIIIDGLNLPEPDPGYEDPGDNSGYNASFDDWSDVHEDIFV